MCLLITAASVTAARAQDVGPATVEIPENLPPDAAIQLGPLYVAPTFELRDVGFDNNVFNDDNEERDFTMTPSATLLNTVLAGPMRVTGVMTTDYVWFQKFRSERSVNNTFDVQVEALLDRFRPWASGAFVRTRAREGFEIDSRAQRTEPTIEGGLDWVIGSRTSLAFSTRRNQTRYADFEQFQGANLSQQLDHTEQTFTAGFRFELTPLTMLLLDAEYNLTSFDGSSLRDNNGWALMPRRCWLATDHCEVIWSVRPSNWASPTGCGSSAGCLTGS